MCPVTGSWFTSPWGVCPSEDCVTHYLWIWFLLSIRLDWSHVKYMCTLCQYVTYLWNTCVPFKFYKLQLVLPTSSSTSIVLFYCSVRLLLNQVILSPSGKATPFFFFCHHGYTMYIVMNVRQMLWSDVVVSFTLILTHWSSDEFTGSWPVICSFRESQCHFFFFF